MNNFTLDDIHILSKKVRRKILDMSFKSGSSAHIGGSLSMVEILSVLYGYVMRVDNQNPTLATRDRFILSKGHGALALYAVLIELGFIEESVASTYMKNESELIAHPIKNLQLGIESSNGSLGQGLSYAAGLALSAKLKKEDHKVYVLLGDGECNEGSIWEAAAFASHVSLDNLIAIVDFNGFQNDGKTDSIISNTFFSDKWRSFGWHVIEVDGHDINFLISAISNKSNHSMPHVFIAKTIKGKGISFMESNNTWHHNRLTESTYLDALRELR